MAGSRGFEPLTSIPPYGGINAALYPGLRAAYCGSLSPSRGSRAKQFARFSPLDPTEL
ncbi:MAG: hypothetical protein V1778_01800 [bacterium]